MTKDEMRFIRREFINTYLHMHGYMPAQSEIKYYVRLLERVNYGMELQVYA